MSASASSSSSSPSPLSDSESPRKRRRLINDESNAADDADLDLDSTEDGPPHAVRDSAYYFSDGSCIIRVEDTLFNVHRTILSRDSSSFSSLFMLPQGGQKSEGTTDDNPIVLRGDTAIEFRNFLWAMYAMPHEAKTLFDKQEDVSRLLDIAKVANKYCFKSLETWACDGLQGCAARHRFPLSKADLAQCTQLARIIRVAQLCGATRLLATAVGVLQERLALSPECVALALTLADDLTPPVPALAGAAYYAALLRGPAFWDAPDTRLQPHQRLRVLSGYYELTTMWVCLQASPPEFVHASSCMAWNHVQCTASWNSFWREKAASEEVMKLGLADVGGRLKVILYFIDHWGPWGQTSVMHHECKKEVRKGLLAKLNAFEKNLSDYFAPI